MTKSCNCQRCPAFEQECKGCTEPCRFGECDGRCGQCAVHCHRRQDLDDRLAAIGGLALDAPLKPQPALHLPLFLPQLINGLTIPDLLARESAAAVGIEKALTPRGEVSRRAIPREFGPHSLRRQWGVGEGVRLICIGNARDDHLEKLWKAQGDVDIWGRIMALGFDAAASLNFSIYLDDPRLEHLLNIKRTWLTVRRMQATSSLIPIPHLQWATLLDLERQLDYAQAEGFHTLTLNLQMVKRQGWDTVAEGLALIRERAPDGSGERVLEGPGRTMRFLFAGVAGLKRMARLAGFFPDRAQVAFTNANAHYLAEHYIRLQRDGPRLIKEPVRGHPDRILLDNLRLYRGFLAELYGPEPVSPRTESPEMRRYLDALQEICTALTTRFGFAAAEADAWADRLATDEEVLYACQDWLRGGQLDRDFGGSFPAWPQAECVSQPTMGQLLDGGRSPLAAFQHLADLAQQVYEEIEIFVGQAGY